MKTTCEIWYKNNITEGECGALAKGWSRSWRTESGNFPKFSQGLLNSLPSMINVSIDYIVFVRTYQVL